MLPDAGLLAGIALGVSLAAPPGPVTALMANEVARRGARAGIWVGLGATTADLGFFVLALLGAVALLRDRPLLLGAMSLVGAALLLWFARGAWRAARAPAEAGEARATFRSGFLAAATSPFNLAWWLGTGSPLFANAGAGLGVGMFLGIVAWVLLFTHAVAALGHRVRRFQEGVAYASAAVLAAFAAWIAWTGLGLLGLAPA